MFRTILLVNLPQYDIKLSLTTAVYLLSFSTINIMITCQIHPLSGKDKDNSSLCLIFAHLYTHIMTELICFGEESATQNSPEPTIKFADAPPLQPSTAPSCSMHEFGEGTAVFYVLEAVPDGKVLRISLSRKSIYWHKSYESSNLHQQLWDNRIKSLLVLNGTVLAKLSMWGWISLKCKLQDSSRYNRPTFQCPSRCHYLHYIFTSCHNSISLSTKYLVLIYRNVDISIFADVLDHATCMTFKREADSDFTM